MPITLRPLTAGHRPKIDGALTVAGQYTIWRDLEICYIGWMTRETEITGSAPGDLPLSKTLNITGTNIKLINCVIHDLSGPGAGAAAVDLEMYGCLIYNNGWNAPDRGHGHGAYLQNLTGTKRFRNCVFAQGYSEWGVHAYTESGSIQGFEFEDVIHFPPRFLVGGYTPVDRLTLRRCHLRGGLQIGYQESETNGSATLENVTAVDALTTSGDWGTGNERITQSGNRFSASGLNETHVIANEYDDDRATVVIYNAALADTVDVDLSALPLTVGREYVLRNAQNYFGDTPISFTYTGLAVAVSMTGWTVAVPIGASEPLVASSFPAFGCFLLEAA
jgi:hypothetical protein